MGIQGLLPYLKKASRAANVKEFKGSTVAIDSYCWLHRGAFACAEKLAMGEKTDQYVYYCMKYVNFLLSQDIKPIMVFDGCNLPSKKEVEKTRRERRDTYRKKAAQFLREGKRSEARDCLAKCVDITPQMALDLMNACRAKGVDCIVAPYEADAQLAYLCKIGVAQLIITEDSDLVLFGCEKVIFKMDFNGNGILVEKKNLNIAMDLKPDSYTFEKFRYMCIMSGCDYLPNLPGIGLAKATKFFRLSRQTDITLFLKKIPSTLNISSLTVPEEYIKGFHRANKTFLYQLVFDPIKRELLPLHPYPPEVDPDDLDYAGPRIEQQRAFHIALGNIDIHTGKRMADFDPDNHQPKSQSWNKNGQEMLHKQSMWTRNYRPMSNITSHKQETLLSHMTAKSTHGKEVTVKAKLKVLPKSSPVKRVREDLVMDKDVMSTYHTDDPDFQPSKRMKPNNNLSMQEALEQAEKPSELQSNRNSDNGEDKKRRVSECVVPVNSPENKIKSPRNMFACGSNKMKKERFSLASPRRSLESGIDTEVKSRFFKEDKPLQLTNFYKELDKGHNIPVKDSEDGSSESEDEASPSRPASNRDHASSQPPNTAESLSSAPEQNSSPYGSFGFSKKVGTSLLNKFKSSFDKNPASPRALNEQFKPVLPQRGTNVKDYPLPDCTEVDGDSTLAKRTELSSSNLAIDAVVSSESISVSQRTNLYSIDSYSQPHMDLESSVVSNLNPQEQNTHVSQERSCFWNNSQTGESSLKTSSSKSRRSSVKSENLDAFYQSSPEGQNCELVIEISAKGELSTRTNDLQIVSNSGQSQKSSTAKQTPNSSKPVTGCRASGLSKAGRKKGGSTNKQNNENQPAISKFFATFANNKSENKLQAVRTKKVLSPHRDNGEV